jgi:hypothetical protein
MMGRKRGRPRTRPLKPPSYPAHEKRVEFRLHGPWYSFDYEMGPMVVAWARSAVCPIFIGSYAECQALLEREKIDDRAER